MTVDYIIVGIGLAGISFCEQLRKHNKTFVVFDDQSQQSSVVAGGLYNPIVLKRFTGVWKSKEQLSVALNMYGQLEILLGVKLDYKIPVYRKFASLEEQNDWFMASDKPQLSKYLSTELVKNSKACISAPLGFGEVFKTGRIDTNTLIDNYKLFLKKNNLLIESRFDYDQINLNNKVVQYKTTESRFIVFAEGFGVIKNPYFSNLPLVPTKGELLTIHAPQLKVDYVLKSSVFIIPLEDDLYLIGATYDWKDTSNSITETARESLLSKLNTIISCPYEVVNHVAGVRPTVKDRRPLVGQHKAHKNMYVLNGLGTRGVMIGPYVSQALYNFIENGEPMDREIDIKRFE
ncbi:NAD(P)/FAD-dependent oxidoreductase [Changchengzhania lutea]|uniref:NAD(P)/FAD-dependent oxidoreductase n=1 Tax=Changchengzhania lutea TaxID=2049305 RepID=UPI00115EA72B|nr:FAD-dependent oxidoreductase [Changchengzhania lutea]